MKSRQYILNGFTPVSAYWLYLVHIPNEKTMLSITKPTPECSVQLCLGLESAKTLGFPLSQSWDIEYSHWRSSCSETLGKHWPLGSSK